MELTTIKNKNHFNQQLEDAGSKLVVVDFYADWCGPCRMMAPALQEIAQNNSEVVILKVNVDDNGELAAEYEVQGIPNFVFIKNKVKVSSFSGANKEKLNAEVNKLK